MLDIFTMMMFGFLLAILTALPSEPIEQDSSGTQPVDRAGDEAEHGADALGRS